MLSDAVQQQYAAEIREVLARLELEPPLGDLEAVVDRVRISLVKVNEIVDKPSSSAEVERRDFLDLIAEYVIVAHALRVHGASLLEHVRN